jgi:hypothetical protein
MSTYLYTHTHFKKHEEKGHVNKRNEEDTLIIYDCQLVKIFSKQMTRISLEMADLSEYVENSSCSDSLETP